MYAAKRVCLYLPKVSSNHSWPVLPGLCSLRCLRPEAFLNSCTTALGGFLVTAPLDMYHA